MDRFDQMTTFVRVAELGGFAAAARDLGAAPSAVTTHIQALERRLGARLVAAVAPRSSRAGSTRKASWATC